MDFDYQPVLKGELLMLRPLGEDDFDDLFGVASDPAIWEQHPVRDRFREPVFRSFFAGALASGGTLVALDAADGRMIGSSRFHGHSARWREVEIGWTFLARSHWGGAYNGEIKRLMCEHAFRFVDSVVLLIGPDNRRSLRAAEKIGAIREGMRPDAGGWPSLVYRLRKPEPRAFSGESA
ncbi:MAG: GNAT family N-acetyltransferase [Gemmatimonadota bacterium]|jgi:RimJ/RimL family protein N-acetyltransferase